MPVLVNTGNDAWTTSVTGTVQPGERIEVSVDVAESFIGHPFVNVADMPSPPAPGPVVPTDSDERAAE